MSEAYIGRMTELSLQYQISLDRAKRYPDSKKGLGYYMEAATAQYEMSRLTTGDVALRHRQEMTRLIHLVQSEMSRMGIKIETQAAVQSEIQPEPAQQNAVQSAAQPAQKPQSSTAPSGGKPANDELKGFDPDMFRIKDASEASFEDFGEMDPAVEAVVRSLNTAFLMREYPELAKQMPAQKPHVLLYGPPGGGKSHFCTAVCNYVLTHFTDGSFFLVTAGDIRASLVGVAEKRLGALFREMEKYEMPVLCIDEIETLCPSRDGDNPAHVASLVTEFLQYIEGVAGKTKAVIIGATNYPWKVDSAIRSRMRNLAYVGLPDRKHIFDYLSKNLSLYLGDDEAYREKVLNLCADRMEHASYRNLLLLRGEISQKAFDKTVAADPSNKKISKFLPVDESEVVEILDRIVIDYDAEYVERLQNPELW